VSTLLQDVRFALRQLWKHPGFAGTAILSLALGIAATVSVFSVVYSVLINPSPYMQADRLAQFFGRAKSGSDDPAYVSRDYIDALRNTHAIEELVQMDEEYLADTTFDIPQDVDVVYLSSNAFPFFGVPAYLGRTFLPSDAPEGQAPQPVVVLTYQYWKRRFNGNRAIIGQSLRLDNRNYTILGVMPPRFTWWDAEVYAPLDTSGPGNPSHMVVVRLRPGVTHAQALKEVRPIFQQMIRDHPNLWIEGLELDVQGINERFHRSMGRTLYILFGGVLLLLVIACVNVSILLLARGTGRQHEFAVRAAVGATSTRIVRQLLTESLILGLSGAALGVIATYRSTPFVVRLLPFQLFPRGLEIPVHIPVLSFSVLLAVVTSILFGLFPALQLMNPEIREVMQATTQKASGSVASRRFHAVLIAGQIAMAMVLLTASASAIQSFREVLHIDLGFDPNNVADYSIPVHRNSYTTWEARSNYFQQLRDKVAQTPGVTEASIALLAPPSSTWYLPIEILGKNSLDAQLTNINFVDSHFFSIFHIPLLQGRLWEPAEAQHGARLAIVNQEFVRRYFPQGDAPLGHSVRIPRLKNHPPQAVAVDGSDSWLPIIGVVKDVRNDDIDKPVKPEVYVPYSLYMIEWTQILVRTTGDPLALESTIRRQIASINPGQQVSWPVITLKERIEQQAVWAREHLIAVLASLFSVLALVLATVGLYSVVSYSVAQRIHEFGIRMALGAQRRHILKNVLGTAGVSVGVGLLVGLVLSFSLNGLFSRWIGNGTSNPLLILGVCLLLLVVALLACIVPGFRASLIQPMKALRIE
jgi:predicted permease